MNDTTHRVLSVIQNSPYPASVGGHGLLYLFNLTVHSFIFMVAAGIFFKISKTIWKDRATSKMSSAVNCWRMFVMSTMLIDVIFSGSTIIYFWSINDVSPETSQLLLMAKRIAETTAVLPFMLSVTLLVLMDEQISYHLKHPMMTATFDITSRKEKLKDMFYLLGSVAIISTIATVAKYVNFYS